VSRKPERPLGPPAEKKTDPTAACAGLAAPGIADSAAPAIPAIGADAGTAASSRQLLEQIAAAVQKESLEPILHSLPGARLIGTAVILDAGRPLNEFLRRQLKDNLPLIAQAASQVLGKTVQVVLDDVVNEAQKGQPGTFDASIPSGEGILERARKDPAVQSFLDTFPGPVKAEKL
jgi:hypothetical protein